MPNGSSYVSFSVNERDKISNFINLFSPEMFEYMDNHPKSEFFMFYKHMTHSDLITSGKATKPNKLHKNLLYYIKKEEMEHIEESTGKPFQTAHQSCIGLSVEVYNKLGIPNPREITNEEGKHQYKLNDYVNVFIEKNNMKYFSSQYTTKVFDNLEKEYDNNNWDNNSIVFNDNDNFKAIDLHCAVHGLGIEADTEFHKIRHNLFKGDVLVLLCEIRLGEKTNVFILFEKNPIFFNIIGETNLSYVRYQERLQNRRISELTAHQIEVDEDDEVTRAMQGTWRDMLANEMMAYTQVDRQVMCPFTYIQADYDDLGTIYIASHIKGFKDPNTTNEEKYDINNGLLLSCNADALFDKHLITVGENKELIFSYLLEQNYVLKQQLLLTAPIFRAILNDERMKYLEYHRNRFYELEAERRRIQA